MFTKISPSNVDKIGDIKLKFDYPEQFFNAQQQFELSFDLILYIQTPIKFHEDSTKFPTAAIYEIGNSWSTRFSSLFFLIIYQAIYLTSQIELSTISCFITKYL